MRRSGGEDAEDDERQGVVEAAHQRDLRRALVHGLGTARTFPEGVREVVLPDCEVGPLHDSFWRLPDSSLRLLLSALLLFVPMPPKRTKDGRPNIGLDYGLSVPKFLQPYQNMLGEASVFRNQIRKEEEEEEEMPLPVPIVFPLNLL